MMHGQKNIKLQQILYIISSEYQIKYMEIPHWSVFGRSKYKKPAYWTVGLYNLCSCLLMGKWGEKRVHVGFGG